MTVEVRLAGRPAAEGVEGLAEALASDLPVWIDLHRDDLEALEAFRDRLPGHPLSWEDAGKPSQRPKMEDHGDHLFLVFRGLNMAGVRLAQQLETVQLAVFLTSRLLITIRCGDLTSVRLAKERLLRDPKLLAQGADVCLHAVLDPLVDLFLPHVEAWEEEVGRLEKEALHQPRNLVLARILAIRKHMVHLRHITASHREVVSQLGRGRIEFVQVTTRPYFQDVQDHLSTVLEETDNLRDSVMLAVDIYQNAVNNRMNQVMKVLTMMSAVVLPLTLLTGVFGMNFDSLPGLHHPGAFKWFVGISAVVLTGMLGMFRILRWL